MSSSISSSEAGGAGARIWRRFLGAYLLMAALGGGLLAGALCLIDPFDTGRFGELTAVGVPQMGPRLANASRGRDQRFDSAVIGNSNAQLIAPERLGALTGRRFVSLTVPGTGPLEQLAVARWFVAHHEGQKDGGREGALVIGIDRTWCQPDGALTPPNPFPFWLYARDRWDYVAGLLKTDSLRHAGGKLALLAGLAAPARPDGYDDYDQGRVWRAEEVAARLAEPAPWTVPAVADRPSFPAVAQLRAFLAERPKGMPVGLLFPPLHARALPAAGTPGARLMELCKQAFGELAAAHGPAVVVDMALDGDLARRDENFWDLTHYRGPVARMVEERLAEALPGASRSAAIR